MTRLHLDLRVGETFSCGDVRLTLERKSGQVARLIIEADPQTRITLPRRDIHFAHECDAGQQEQSHG
jgi:hypothetical protein